MQIEHLHSVHSKAQHTGAPTYMPVRNQTSGRKKKRDEAQKGSLLPDKLILSTVLKKKKVFAFFIFSH